MSRLDEVRQRFDAGGETIGDIMMAYALDAVDHASGLGFKLDFSEESINEVECILDRIFRQRPRGIRKAFAKDIDPTTLEKFCKMYGGYIGEVMRFEWGNAEWTLPEDGVFKGAFTIDYQGMLTSPPAKVYKRLTDGSADNVYAYYRVLRDERNGELMS
jgi:hypothetical protein